MTRSKRPVRIGPVRITRLPGRFGLTPRVQRKVISVVVITLAIYGFTRLGPTIVIGAAFAVALWLNRK